MLDSAVEFLSNNILTLCLGITVFVCVSWLTRRPVNFPPGPWAIPFIGSPVTFGNPEEIFPKLRKKYGDVFCFYAGSQPIIAVGGFETIREALVKLGHVTSGRPSSILNDKMSKRKGLLSTQGPFWKEQRTFTMNKLRQFGMGKGSLESRALEEVTEFVDYLKTFDGKPIDLHQHLFNSVSNVILSVVAGKRFQYEDPKFISFLGAIKENFGLVTPLLNIFPWLMYIPGDFFHFRTIMKNMNTVTTFSSELIAEHKASLDPNDIRDFIDAYLVEMKEKTGDPDTSFSEEQLVYLTADLYVAGSETTSTTINWGILYLSLYPTVQQKLQEEIDSVVGQDRFASIKDKINLPYTEATLMEIQRIANLGLFLPPHSTSEEITLKGYTIPKGTTLMVCGGETLFDPAHWTNPKEFQPERFLKEGKVVHPDFFFPFSLGKRSCPGEALAKMELFLFFTALMQRFNFKFPEGEPAPSTERVVGFTATPKSYRVRAIQRY